jgi:hypothetical protein
MQSSLLIGHVRIGSCAEIFRIPAVAPSENSLRPSWKDSSDSVVPVVTRKIDAFQDCKFLAAAPT